MKQHRQQPIPTVVSVTDARRHFDQIQERAAKHRERFVITYRGKPAIAIPPIAEFRRITGLK
jgi:prevent-host-death family protein